VAGRVLEGKGRPIEETRRTDFRFREGGGALHFPCTQNQSKNCAIGFFYHDCFFPN